MPPPETPNSSRNLIGPESLGHRVVIRRRLRDQVGVYGGVVMSDVVGICLAWSDTTVTVETATGEQVGIEIADIAAGKTIPARPVRRRPSNPR